MRKIPVMLTLSAMMVGFLFPSVYAETSSVYVSTDGVIDGFSGEVYTTVEDALNNLSADGGTVFVDGSVVLPAAPNTSALQGKTITFSGYDHTAEGNTVELKNTVKSFIPTSPADIVFDNITVKHQDGSTTEDWVFPNGGSITFGANCLYEHGYRADRNQNLKIYIGSCYAAKGGTINFNAPNVQYADVASLAGYFGGTSSNFTTSGDVVYHFNAGTFDNVYGGLRNGTSGYATLNGDVYYNFNGATLASGGSLAMGNLSNGVINGNIFFTVNGGNINRTLKLGAAGNVTEGMASFGNLILTLDGKKIAENGGTVKLTVADGKTPETRGKNFILLNHKSALDANSNVTLTINAQTVDYYIAAQGGTVTPVFEKSSDGNVGNFLGFEATPDTEEYVPAINGIMLDTNASGLYVIESSPQMQTVNFVAKSDLVSQITLKSGLEGQDDMTTEYRNGDTYTIPACPFTLEDGTVFAGWASDDTLYHEGDIVTVRKDMTLTATYVTEKARNYFFVSADGRDDNDGLTIATAFATVKAAVAAAQASECETAFVYLNGSFDYSDVPVHEKTVTFRNGTLSGDITISGDTVFDTVSLVGNAIYTGGHSAEFTEKVTTNETLVLVLGDKSKGTSGNTVLLRGGRFAEVTLSNNADTSSTVIHICGADIGTLTLGSETALSSNVAVIFTSGKVENVSAGTLPAGGKVTVYRDGTQLAIEAAAFANASVADIENLTGLDDIDVLSDATLSVAEDVYIYAMGDDDVFYSIDGTLSVSAGKYQLRKTTGEGAEYLPYPTPPENKYFDAWQTVSAGHLKALFTDRMKINPYYVSMNGSDENAGTSTAAPFKTLTAAVGAIGKNADGKVIIMDTAYWSTNASTCNVPSYNGTITFEGLNPDAVDTQIIDYSESTDANATTAKLDLKGNSIFKNISFKAHHYKSLYTNDYELRLEGKIGYIKGVSGNSVFTMTAGKYGSAVKNTSVYLGAQCHIETLNLGHNSASSITGKLDVVIDGANVKNMVVGGTGAKLHDVDIVYFRGSVGSLYTNASNTTTSISGNFRYIKNNGLQTEFVNNANSVIGGETMIFNCDQDVSIAPMYGQFYNVLTDMTVRAEDTENGNVYYSSKGGSLWLPDGSYNLTKSETDYYTNDGRTIEILADTALTFDERIYCRAGDGENLVFTGWYYKDSDSAPTSGDTLPAGTVLEAHFEPYDPAGGEFGIIGVQVRVANSDVSQGLRFIVNKENSFDSKFDMIEYGAVIIPRIYLQQNELVKNGLYDYNGKTYQSRYITAKNIFKETDSGLWYTLCLTGIVPENYDRLYAVRSYAICKTANGAEFTLYSDTYSSGLVQIVRNNTPQNDTDKAAFDKILSEWKNTYFGDGTTAFSSSHYSTAYTVNSSGVGVREVTIDSGLESGKTVQIAMITDSHLNTNIPGHTEALIKAMKCAKFSDQIVLCGDNVESASSSANMALLQEVVWEPYPDTIAVLGNHEYFYPGSGSMDAVKAKVDALWPHNPDYYSKLVGDKVLVVAADDARQVAFGESVYYFTEEKCDLLEKDIEYARENGYVILFFHHVNVGILDKSLMANQRMYDLVTQNADVIKACFSGHGHVDNKSSLAGSYRDEKGNKVSVSIPCYWLQACAEPDSRGNVLFIHVE